ncbi:MAG: type I-E CRISPR-associated protein Cse2/CasB [Rhodococcus sp. (in: high G+C Gram-positive bacteria)]|uniref:type I-E CRISPR-associated protein Cse2/CasB n=1 Tax=Rhodococcus sp. TaxID=1831 RepID=UPI003BB52DD2
MTEPATDATSPIDRYLRHLTAAAYSNDPGIRRLRTWRPDGAVSTDVLRLTAAAGDDQWIPWALTGKLFAYWNFGRSTVRYGRPGTGLGHALRSIGQPGARGPRNPGAVRLLNRLLTVNSDQELADALDAIGRHLRSVDHPPHWATIAAELEAWRDPSTRTDVHVSWARQFNTWHADTVDDTDPAPTTS